MRKSLGLGICIAAVMAVSLPVSADDAMTTPTFMLKCKSDAAYCRSEIVKGSAAPVKAGEACVPATVSGDDMMVNVLHLLQYASDSGTDLSKNKYTDDIYDAVATLWPCRTR